MYHQQRYLDYYETSANLDLCPSEAASTVSATGGAFKAPSGRVKLIAIPCIH